MRRTGVLIMVLTLLGGCGSEASEPALSDSLTGTDWMSARGKFVVFREDGTFGVGGSPVVGDVSTASREWGTWFLNGKVLSMVPDAESPYCAGVAGTYVVDVVDEGNRLEVAVQDDACNPRRADMSLGLTRQAEAES